MSRLADLLVEWARQKRRWPLLLLLLIPAAFTLVREYYGLTFRQTLQHTFFLSAAAADALLAGGLYLYFQYADRLRHSAWLNRRPGHPRIVVSDAVAWQMLRYTSPDGEARSRTVVEELTRLLAGLPYRVVVVRQRAIVSARYADEYGCEAFYVDGKVEGAGVLLHARMVISERRVPKIVDDAMKNVSVGTRADEFLFVQARRFLPNPFFSSGFGVEVPLTPAMLPEHRTAAALLILRYTLATLLFYDHHPDADRLFRDVMDMVRLGTLPAGNSTAIAMIYGAAGYYFAVHRQRMDEALAALDVAERFNPADVQIRLMQAYLCLASGRLSRTKDLLELIAPGAEAHQLFHVLRGGHHMALNQFPEAIAAFETALRLDAPGDPDSEPDDDHGRAMLHLRIAVAYGQADHMPDKHRAAEMITHTEDAIGLEPSNPGYHILQGFGWALQKNAEMSRRAFERAEDLVETDEQMALLGYWRARSFAAMDQYASAVEELERLIGDPKTCTDTNSLLRLAQNLLRAPGREAEAEQHVDRIIEIDPEDGRAHHEKAMCITRRFLQLPASAAGERHELSAAARKALLQSIRLGQESATGCGLLATMYEDAGDWVNAERYYRRAGELDPENARWLSVARAQMAQDNVSGAEASVERARQAGSMDAEAYIEEGLLWQAAGRTTQAERAYREAVRLAPDAPAGRNNLAFVLFDLGHVAEALLQWERARGLDPTDADSLAGKAIALDATGHHLAAIDAYRDAVKQDGRFLDVEILKKEFMWSEAACRAARPLIAELTGTVHDGPVGNART